MAKLSASVVVVPSLSFKAPSTGIVVEAKSYWKPWEATPASGSAATLSKDITCGASALLSALADWEEEDPGAALLWSD